MANTLTRLIVHLGDVGKNAFIPRLQSIAVLRVNDGIAEVDLVRLSGT